MSAEQRRKISAALKGRPKTTEHKKATSRALLRPEVNGTCSSFEYPLAELSEH